MNLDLILSNLVIECFAKIFNVEFSEAVEFQATRKEFEGSHTLVVFPYTKLTKKSPEETCKIIGDYLVAQSDLVARYNVVKGFLNITLKDDYWVQFVKYISNSDTYGKLKDNGLTVMVEYSSPNTNKPLHLGHLRNNFLGYSVSQILEASGYAVIKANLINDRGIHICKSMLAYQKFGNGETPESTKIKGDHLVGKYYVEFDKALKLKAAELRELGWTEEEIEKKNPLLVEAQDMLRLWESNDPEVVALWNMMNSWVYAGFEATYKRMGVKFDKYYYESDTYLLGKSIVEEGVAKGVFYHKEDNSVWIDLSAEGLDQKLVLRADGTSVYITQDMGTADLKHQEFGIDKSVYVVGNEQDYHFVVLKHIMTRLKRSYASGIHHLSYGMVDLPSGKMKSREGTVVDADDLMQELVDEVASFTRESGKIDDFEEDEANQLFEKLGIGALKYYLLKVDPKKRMLFNPQESIDLQGNTGPYIQYTHARIKSVLRKANQLNLDSSVNFEIEKLESVEKDVIIWLSNYEQVIKQAALEYAPSLIANYVYELAKYFNTFYNELSVLKEIDDHKLRFRVVLCYTTGKVIKSAMLLLGIEVPERM